MESSADLFKNSLDKAYSSAGMKINTDTMRDAEKYKQSFKEEKIEGGIADGKTLMDVVRKHSKNDPIAPSTKKKIGDIFRKIKIQLNKGIKVEMEHTKSRVKAKEIAMDHLWEDPKYYDKLKKIESKEEKESKYLDIQDMIPMLRKQLMKGTKVDQKQKKERTKSKEEPNEATSSGSSGAYSAPLFSGEMEEKWSEDYKKSIDCTNPKGFSQKAHCQSKGKKKETKEATGSGSTGAFTAPVGFKDSEFVRRSFKETPKLKENGVEKTEATGSGSTGGSSSSAWAKSGKKKDWGPSRNTEMTGGKFVKEQVEKVEATEATTSGSVGGYESPAMWAKSTKKKDWGPSRKTQIPGGGFVKIKKKCTKFPYCNQGDISNLKISKNESVKEAIKQVATKMGISENVIITILEHEYEKVNKRKK
jgi:Protein of unknown function (DUF5661)